jgi:hypothetical protein
MMSKAKIAPQPAAPKRPFLPLKEITITWPHQSPWMATPEDREITGEQLATCLDVVVPMLRAAGDATMREATVAGVSYRLEGLAELMDSVRDDERLAERHHPAMFGALADYARRLALEVRGADDSAADRAAKAVVKLAPRAPAPKAVR